MNKPKSSNNSFVIRTGRNAHRYICYINGKLRSFQTHEKDFDSVIAELFGSLNACAAPAMGQLVAKALVAAAIPLMLALPAQALPTGAQVVSGDVTITQPNANTMNVKSGSNSSIVNYNSFNVWRNETVNFMLPSSRAAILNRVLGGDPSQIFGRINSNGRVFLINPSGIIFGSTAQVNVGSLFASTMNISDHDFLNNNLVFKNPGTGIIDIQKGAMINAVDGGSVVLAAAAVRNAGTITAPNGQVHVAVGNQLTMQVDNGVLVNLSVDEPLLKSAQDYADAILNTGTIVADGGLVKLQAKLQADMYQRAVNNEGRVQAQSVAFKNGVVEFSAEGGNAIVQNSGTIDVSGTAANGDAGSVTLEGDRVVMTSSDTAGSGAVLALGVQDENGKLGKGGKISVLGDSVVLVGNTELNASGEGGGGEILVGGDLQGGNGVRTSDYTAVGQNVQLLANANTQGDGGKVIVWSDDATVFLGTAEVTGGQLSGNGGFVEVSGAEGLVFEGNVDATAANGETGTLLLDPRNITIVESSATNNDTELNDNSILHNDGTTNDFRITAAKLESIAGNVNIELQAKENIFVQDLSSPLDFKTGAGNSVTFRADADLNGTGGFYMLDLNDQITTQGGSINIFGKDIVVGQLLTRGGNISLDTSGSGANGTIFAYRLSTGNDYTTTPVSGVLSLTGKNIYQGYITGQTPVAGAPIFLAKDINLNAANGVVQSANVALTPTFWTEATAGTTAWVDTNGTVSSTPPANGQWIYVANGTYWRNGGGQLRNYDSGNGWTRVDNASFWYQQGNSGNNATLTPQANYWTYTNAPGSPATEVATNNVDRNYLIASMTPSYSLNANAVNLKTTNLSVNAANAQNLNNLSSVLNLKASSVSNTLGLTTAGNLNVTGVVNAGNIDFDAVNGGNIVLGANVTALNNVDLNAAGNIEQTAGLLKGGDGVGNDTFNLTAGGNLGSAYANPLNVEAFGANNRFTAKATGGSAWVYSATNLSNVGPSSAAGDFVLASNGALTINGDISGSNVLLAAGLGPVGIPGNGTDLNLNANVTATQANGVVNLVADEGSIHQASGTSYLVKGHALNVRAKNDVNSTSPIEIDVNELLVNAGGNVDLHNLGNLNLNTSTVGGEFKLQTVAQSDAGSLNIQGNVTAGSVDFDAAGRIDVNAAVKATNVVDLHAAGTIDNNNTIVSTASRVSLTSDSGTVINDGSVTAKNNVLFDAAQQVVNNGAVTSTDGNVRFEADSTSAQAVDNNSTVKANKGNVEFVATQGGVDNAAAVSARSLVKFDAAKNVVNTASVNASLGFVEFDADQAVNNSGIVHAMGHVQFQAGTDVKNSNSVTSGIGNVVFTANTGEVDNSGVVQATGSVKFQAETDVNNTNSVTSGFGGVAFTADTGNVANSGVVQTAGNVHFHAGTDVSNTASLTSNLGQVKFHADNGDVQNDGQVTALQSIEFEAAQNVTNTANVSSSLAAVDLLANAGTVSNSGTVQGATSVHFHAGTDVNNTASVTAQFGGVNFTAQNGSVDNTGVVKAAANVKFDAAHDVNNYNSVTSSLGRVEFSAGNNVQNYAAGTVTAFNDVQFDAGNDVSNSATVTSQIGDVTFKAGDDVVNSSTGNVVASNGDVNFLAMDMVNNLGVVTAKNNVLFDADALVNDDSFSGIQNSGTVTAQKGDVTFTSDADILNTNLIEATEGSVNMTATGDISNHEGVITAGTDVDLHATNITNLAKVTSTASIRAKRDVLMTASNDIVNESNIEAVDGDVSMVAVGDITNNTGDITAGNDIKLSGNNISNLESTYIDPVTFSKVTSTPNIRAKGQVLLSANNDIINEGNVVSDTDSVMLTAGSDISNVGNIIAERSVALLARDEINNRGNIEAGENVLAIATGSDLFALSADGAIINSGTIKAGDTAMLLSNGDIENSGQVVANTTVLAASGDIENSGLLQGDAYVGLMALGNIHNQTGGQILGADIDGLSLGGDIVNNGMIGYDQTEQTSEVLLMANGNLLGTGLTSGTNINLMAGNNITFRTNASNLSFNAGGDVNLFESNSVILRDSYVGGRLTFRNGTLTPGIYDPNANNNVVFGGTVTAIGGGSIISSGSILDNNPGTDLISRDDFTLLALGGTIGTFPNPLDVDVRGGDLFVGATGSNNGFSVVINGVVQPSNTLRPLFIPPGAVMFNGQYLFGNGPIKDLLTQGLPSLLYDYNNRLGIYRNFTTNKDVIANSSMQNVVAEIINRVGEPQPFDLRFIEEQGENGEPVLMLMMAN